MKNWLLINFNKKYFLKVGNQVFPCQIGEGGLEKAVKKTEGDKTTPLGICILKQFITDQTKFLNQNSRKKMF